MEQKNSEQNKSNINNTNSKKNATLILLYLCYIAACVYIPLSTLVNMGEWMTLAAALAICVFSGIALARMAGGFKPIGGFAIIVGIFVFFGGAILPMALLVAFASAVCIYSGLLIKEKSWMIFILPAIPLVIAGALTRSLAGAVLALATLPCAIMLTVSIKQRLPRVGAICRISAALCVFAVASFALAVYSLTGELSISAASSVIESARTQLTLLLNEAISQMSEMMGGELVGFDVANLVDITVSSVFNLLPAIVITVSNIAAYVIHSLFMTVHFTSDEQRKQALPMLTFEMSLASGVIYILALVLSLILTKGNAAIYGAAAQNVILVLAPGLILTALAGIRTLTLRKGPSCLGTLLYMGVILMLASLSPYVIVIVALAGAILNLISHIAKNKDQKN